MSDNTHTSSSISVSAPARLHLGFLDLNGEMGRRFGSIGLAVSDFETTITGQLTDVITVHHADDALCQRVHDIVLHFYQTLGHAIPTTEHGVTLSIINTIPSHAGLGSGTQLALVIGTILSRLHGLSIDTKEIALQLGRGMRSGIGIATFDHGGFVVDGGLKPNTSVPPTLFQYPFPEDWRIVLVRDPMHQGMHGEQEKSAFTNLPVFPTTDAQTICHLTLMQLLPAVMEADLADFGEALTCIQCLIGDHFAPAQGGRFSSQAVAAILAHATQLGHNAIAQSSWGPTGCIFVESPAAAIQLTTTLNDYMHTQPLLDHLLIDTVQANHQGAVITQTTV